MHDCQIRCMPKSPYFRAIVILQQHYNLTQCLQIYIDFTIICYIRLNHEYNEFSH